MQLPHGGGITDQQCVSTLGLHQNSLQTLMGIAADAIDFFKCPALRQSASNCLSRPKCQLHITDHLLRRQLLRPPARQLCVQFLPIPVQQAHALPQVEQSQAHMLLIDLQQGVQRLRILARWLHRQLLLHGQTTAQGRRRQGQAQSTGTVDRR